MTIDEKWARAKALFEEAAELSPEDAAQRLGRLDDPEVAREVLSLLAYDRQSTEFLERPAGRLADLPFDELTDDVRVGQSIGPWRLVDVIGRGGMGVVYRACRADDAFRRDVAVKLVRAMPDAAEVTARFQRERETLAALDHPNIARLLDGGTTTDGHPYFVMELVDGVRVDEFCDREALPVAARLRLFRAICAGVQYAHGNLVVHRDIKPDNILVARDGTPKLLDFGVAKILSDRAVAADDGAAARATWLMTPDFASPEQIAGRPITTASDVYSLGVLLYVLLTGARPYSLTAAGPESVQRQLTAVVPVAPSERVSVEGEAATERARRRGETPRRLARRLAGDLDAIVQTALARDPVRRYATVEQLVADLDAHVAGHPVRARAGGWSYRTGRFIGRYRVAVALASLAAVALVAGISAVLWQASIASEARTRAERRFADVRALAGTFMFDVHDALADLPATMAARSLMVKTTIEYLDRLSQEATGDRGLERELADAYVRVGDAQGHPASQNLGDTKGALNSYARAMAIAGPVSAATDAEMTRTLALAHRRLADVLAWTGDIPGALANSQKSRRLFDDLARLATATADDRFQQGVAELKLGDVIGHPNLPNAGRPEDAVRQYQLALSILQTQAVQRPDDWRVQRYLGLCFERIGTLHEAARRWTDATAAYDQSFAIRQALAKAQPGNREVQRDAAIADEKLGNMFRSAGRLAEAVARYRGALTQFDRLLSLDPMDANAARTAAISREKLAAALTDLGERAEAAAFLTAALDSHRDLARRDPRSATSHCDAARVSESLGDTLQSPRTSDRADARVCGFWKESVTLREGPSTAGRLSCASERDLARLRSKLERCR